MLIGFYCVNLLLWCWLLFSCSLWLWWYRSLQLLSCKNTRFAPTDILMLENGKLYWLWMIDIFLALWCMQALTCHSLLFNSIVALKFHLILSKGFNCLNSDNLRKQNTSFEGFSVTVVSYITVSYQFYMCNSIRYVRQF